jgi:HK97 gp10 family phage protein
MSNYVTTKITGLSQLQDALEDLGKKGTTVARGAVRAGAVVVQDALVQNAPKDSGIMAEHIDIRTRKQRGTDLAVSAFIGPNTKEIIHPQEKGKTAGLPRTASFIAQTSEFGTEKEPKRPWMTPAWESNKQDALETMISFLKEKLGL